MPWTPIAIRVLSTFFLENLSMSAELWKAIADWATIGLIALTVVSGSTALILGNRITDKQKETLRKFEGDLTTAKLGLAHAQKEGAEAQLALRKYIDDVNASRGPRMIIDHKAFVGAFRGKPKAKAEIWFAPNHEEAYEFAYIAGSAASMEMGQVGMYQNRSQFQIVEATPRFHCKAKSSAVSSLHEVRHLGPVQNCELRHSVQHFDC